MPCLTMRPCIAGRDTALLTKWAGLWSNPVSFTTKVSLPKPTVTVKVNNVVTTSGSTATKTDADNNDINITVAAATAIPTGETADKVEYQIADNLSFNNAYVTSGAAHTVNSAYRLALDGGFIAAAAPATDAPDDIFPPAECSGS